MRRTINVVLVLLVLLFSVQAFAGAGGIRTNARPVPGQYIVVLNDNVDDVHGLARALTARSGGDVLHVYSHAIKGFAVRMPAAAALALSRNPNVSFVEEDGVMEAVTTQTGATWGLDRIDQRALPLSTSFTYTKTGTGVKAYIIDTGIRATHTQFTGRVLPGYSAIATGGTNDCNGHGTHVAGTVGGSTWGVAKGVWLVPVRVLDCNGSGATSGVIAGVNWVASDHPAGAPAVANMSLGGGASTSLDNAVKNAIADGVAFAVAAGNGNQAGVAQDACKSSPARVATAMTIGATDKTDKKASWSNYGACVDWFAPGVSITSSWYTSDTATSTISGTSMATPHTAGVAALYLEGNTTATPQQVRDALYAATTKGVVTSSKTTTNHLLFTNY